MSYRSKSLFWIFGVCVLLGVLVLGGSWVWKSSQLKKRQQAESAYQDKQYAQAIEIYEALGRNRLSNQELINLADSYRLTAQLGQAEVVYTLVSQQLPIDPEIGNHPPIVIVGEAIQYQKEADRLVARGESINAYTYLEKAITDQPDIQIDLLLILGQLAEQRLDNQRAKDAYDAISELDPTRLPAHRRSFMTLEDGGSQ